VVEEILVGELVGEESLAPPGEIGDESVARREPLPRDLAVSDVEMPVISVQPVGRTLDPGDDHGAGGKKQDELHEGRRKPGGGGSHGSSTYAPGRGDVKPLDHVNP